MLGKQKGLAISLTRTVFSPDLFNDQHSCVTNSCENVRIMQEYIFFIFYIIFFFTVFRRTYLSETILT
jgi:hypothetical protein